VGELDELISKLSREQKLEKKSGKVIVDLEGLGYDKLLGMGKITQPTVVKVSSCSKIAVKKVEESGGQVLKESK